MRKYTLFFSMILLCLPGMAQLNYGATNCQNVAGSFVRLGGTSTAINPVNNDDANSSSIPIGFNFNFNGSTMTHFVLNTNGFIKLGSNSAMTAPTAALFYTAANNYTGGIFNSASTADVNLISAFNHDLIGDTLTEYRYETTGTTGSRILTVEFKNVHDKTTTPSQQFDSINFQIKLYEQTRVIEVVLGEFYSTANNSEFKSSACGLKASTTDLTVVTKPSTFDYSASSFLDGNYTGNAFNFGNNTGATPRPIPDVGRTLRFTPSFPNDLQVSTVYSMGEIPKPYGYPHTISAIITNVGTNPQTNFRAYLNITGANTYVDSSFNIASLAPGNSSNVNFTGFTPQNYGVSTVSITVRPDDNNGNNSKILRQDVNEKVYSFIDTTRPDDNSLGFTNGSGLILAKYTVNGKRYVTGVDVYLSSTVPNNVVYAVVMNTAGTIVGQSPNLNTTAAHADTWQHFDLIDPVLVDNTDFYAGLAQTANPTVAYFPVGLINEVPVRTGAYFFTVLAGSATPTDFQTSGTTNFQPGIKATVAGNELEVLSVTLEDPSCVNASKAIDVTIRNNDSLAVDFSVDTLYMDISSTGAVAQSHSVAISSGTLQPNATQTFNLTNTFNLGVNGSYNIILSAITPVEVDTADNYVFTTVQVIDSADVNLRVTPDSVLCYGVPFTFIAEPYTAGSIMYQWKINGVNSGSQTTDSSFMPTLTWGDTVTVDLLTDHCSATTKTITSNEIVMKINPEPRLISGLTADTVRQGDTKNYVVGLNPGSTYNWSTTDGSIASPTGTAVTVVWGGPNPTATLECEERDSRNCVYTHVLPVNITSTVGIAKLNNQSALGAAFPNPAKNSVTIPVYVDGTQHIQLSLLDITGKDVRTIYQGKATGKTKYDVDLTGLNEGLYFYRLTSDQGLNTVRKLTITK